jgi:hypothetical protein
MALQLRRGTDAERKLATFSPGELIYTTDTKKVFVGDGTTVGGKFVGSFAELGLRPITTWNGSQYVTTYETEYTADGHLIMNTKDITGVRDLAVSRNITSTLKPSSSAYTLGTTDNRWGTVFADSVTITNAITANLTGNVTGNLTGITTGTHNGQVNGNVVSDRANRILVNASTDSFDGVLYGDVYGSVYGNDSSIMVDNLNSILRLASRVTAPSGATVGMIAVADGNTSGWDPLGTNLGVAYPVFYNGTDWKAFALSP